MSSTVGDTIDNAAEQAVKGDRSHAPEPNQLWNDAYAELVKGPTVRIVEAYIDYADGAGLQIWGNKIEQRPGSRASSQGASSTEEAFDGSPAQFEQKLQEFAKKHGQPVSSGIGEEHANGGYVYKSELKKGSDSTTSLQVRDRVDSASETMAIKLETHSGGKSMEFWHSDGKQSHRLDYSGKSSLAMSQASLDTDEDGSRLHTERTFSQ